ncbi:DUF2243 domain-containing protein [Alkalihalobacillus hemicellulosilyticus]|uniref:DUF2243 domain-containing protein n=1 Tax=Halalkalibacter hemicellulosilyticusJCM 9152 TaxID=1236971 RepID=W4QD42_9BACI|nr:DUF2243 domain-containing protein [Halalkalibacter hemicellulosilyticus]GAE29872.1 hypothetical protein JCM9152_1258 [Halalkalibacter hemicellulosilyticusJCM 9152]
MKNDKHTNERKPRLHSKRVYRKRNFWSGFLFGIGFIAFIDEMVFHQLLHWHHFYDLATTNIGLISDGLFHAFSWFATIAGLFLFADLQSRGGIWMRRWWSGVLIGAGLFQLYDGTIQHKVMGIHQIRYVEDVFVYDVTWNVLAVLLIVIGAILLWGANNENNRSGAAI